MKLGRVYFAIPILLVSLLILTREGAELMNKRPMVMGWFLSPHDTKSQYKTMRDNAHVLSHISPTRIAIADTEGNVKCGKDNYALAFAARNGIEVHPLVANRDFNREIAHAVLGDPAKRTKVVDQLLAIIQDWKCSGINVDLENLEAADRPHLNAFMKELCGRFHEHGLLVSIDVAAKTRDAPEAGWSGAYDYEFLGTCCDYVMLMCYDEHWSGGHPGPIGSKPWVRKVLEYTTGVIPHEKVVLGVPFYGYDWPEEGRARGYTSKTVNELIAEKKPTLRWDNTAKYHWFEYLDDNGNKRTVWYEDPKSMEHKIALAQEFGLAGISIWRLGDEDPEYWKLLGAYRSGGCVWK